MNAIGQRTGFAQGGALSGAASFTRGGSCPRDLDGSMQGAGGVGGMVLWSRTHDSGANWSHFFPCYDGNGNVTELLNANGDIAAHWQYDPFGNTVASSPAPVNWASPVAWFAYRFSTEPLDFDTGLYYYGYRWYDPVTGRWPSRDPIGKQGGRNWYSFVGKNGPTRIDLLGLEDSDVSAPTDRAKEIDSELSIVGILNPFLQNIPKVGPVIGGLGGLVESISENELTKQPIQAIDAINQKLRKGIGLVPPHRINHRKVFMGKQVNVARNSYACGKMRSCIIQSVMNSRIEYQVVVMTI